jgi:hypothetical protein
MAVDLFFEDDHTEIFRRTIEALKSVINLSLYKGTYIYLEEINEKLTSACSISKYRAENTSSVILAAMDIYQRRYSGRMNAQMYTSRATKEGKISYSFTNTTKDFFTWLSKGLDYLMQDTDNQKIHIVNDKNKNRCKELTIILGVLESIGVLRFKSLGGSNSQIYIYVNETKNMQMVRDKPQSYRNKLLEMVNVRHQDSVQMLTYLFQNEFTSEEVWDHLENYFLGILPDDLNDTFSNDKRTGVELQASPTRLLIGESLSNDYSTWQEANALFDNDIILSFDKNNIPLADYYASKLIIDESEIDTQLVWQQSKIVITDGEETEELRLMVQNDGWHCIPIDNISITELNRLIQR